MSDQPTTTLTLTFDDLAAAVSAVGNGVFLATTGPDQRPHVAWVVPGWADERMWITTFASSRKAHNIGTNPQVAMTCAATPETNVLIRATARIVDDPAALAELWGSGVVPYDPSGFFSGPDDPELRFVELVPSYASIHPLGGGPARRWTPS